MSRIPFLPRATAGLLLAALLFFSPGVGLANTPFACEGVAPISGDELRAVSVIDNVPGEPLFITQAPGDDLRFFIVDQQGRIFVWKRGTPPDQFGVFLDIRSRVNRSLGNELGLLGLAFDPDYQSTGEFYLYYTEGSFSLASVIARYGVDPNDPDAALPNSEQRLMRFTQPATNHNGGQLFFGDDGFLYISSGDGGSGGDPWGECGNGQNTDTLLGTILRIDVRNQPGSLPADCGLIGAYGVPADNPFAGSTAGCGEIWAYGLRNPWRSSQDALAGDLYIADVGQGCWEEVNWEEASSPGGVNYGWRQMEGTRCYRGGGGCDPEGVSCGDVPDCGDPALTLPVLDYPRAGGACSVTGGYVYRGCRMPDVRGQYFYADYCEGFVRSFVMVDGVATNQRDRTTELFGASFAQFVTSFGQDNEGELFLIERGGIIYRFAPPFSSIEVSGPGAATPFTIGSGGGFSWEDVNFTTLRPISAYKVYRGQPNGVFTCIAQTSEPSWSGDPDVPPPGEQFAYLITALDDTGTESSPGEPEGARQLSAQSCP